MGKTLKKIAKARQNAGLFEFEVLVRVHGKSPHTEKYGIPVEDVGQAKKLGFLNDSLENEVYYDWKPLFHPGKSFSGGIVSVNHYTFDDKYAYAHTSVDGGADYSLPKYLYERMGEKKQIMVGKRLD